jgi:hypothetical protein
MMPFQPLSSSGRSSTGEFMFKPIKVRLRKARLSTAVVARLVCAPRQGGGALGGARQGVAGRSQRILCRDSFGNDTHAYS